jgi:hypothetical protein
VSGPATEKRCCATDCEIGRPIIPTDWEVCAHCCDRLERLLDEALARQERERAN